MRIPFLSKLTEGNEGRVAERAERLLAQGKLDKAVEALRAGLDRSPKSVSLQLDLARALSMGRRTSEAGGALRALLRSNPSAQDAVAELSEMSKLDGMDVSHIHDALAEHSLRAGDLAACRSHLEALDRDALKRFAGVQRKRFLAGETAKDKRVSRAVLLAGTYSAVAHEVASEDAKALDTFARLLELDARLYRQIAPSLKGLAARNFRKVELLLKIFDLHIAHGDAARVTEESMTIVSAVPRAAAAVAERLGIWLADHPEENAVRLAAGQARWAAGHHEEALELLTPLAAKGEMDAELGQLLGTWRAERPDAVGVGLRLAQILGRQGNGARAVQTVAEIAGRLPAKTILPVLQQLIERFPAEGRAHEILADLRAGEGDLDGAVDAIEAARRHDPEAAGRAAGRLRSVLDRDPGHQKAHRLLVRIHLERGEIEPAVVLVRHLLQVDPTGAGDLREHVEKMAAAAPGSAWARLGAAEAWLAAQDPARALPHLAAAAQHPQASAQVAHRLSWLIRKHPAQFPRVEPLVEALRGRLAHPAATPYLRAECAAAAGNPERAAHHLGECYALESKAVDPIVSLLDRLLRAHPSSSPPRVLLANILIDQDDPLRAVEMVTELPDPDPGLISSLLDRMESLLARRAGDHGLLAGMARLLLVAGRPAEALAAADRALKAAGAEAAGRLHLVRGQALHGLGEQAPAVASLGRAARLDPSLHPRVVAVLRRMLETDPGDDLARFALGRLLLEAGDRESGFVLLLEVAARVPTRGAEVLRAIDAVATSRPDDPAPHLAAARLHSVTGGPGAAAERVAEALRRGAGREEAEALLVEFLRAHPEQPELLHALALSRASSDLRDACRLLERAAAGTPAARQRAVAALEELAASNPDDGGPSLAVARIHRTQGDAAAAFAALAPALERGAPPEPVLQLLEGIRCDLPDRAEPSLALARARLQRSEEPEALRALREAREAGAAPERLESLLDRLLKGAESWPEAHLLRGEVRADCDRADEAVEDLQRAARAGEAEGACARAALILAAKPGHPGARRLHVDLLVQLGRADEAIGSLDAALGLKVPEPFRCELLLERADLRRRAGDATGAAADLQEAESLTEDQDSFLERVHARRTRRLETRLVGAGPVEKVRLLLDLGRLDEAERVLAGSEIPPDEERTLRAAVLLARGEAAGGLKLVRCMPAGTLLVDAAQRCSQPGLALAALDRILERREEPDLRRARRRLMEDVWRQDLDGGRQVLVARSPFVPRSGER